MNLTTKRGPFARLKDDTWLSNTIELERLKYFVAVAEEGSRAGAARRLYLTCSAVSQQISKLEGELGVELFRRNGRRSELTEAGEILLAGARQALERIELAVTEARRVSDQAPPEKEHTLEDPGATSQIPRG